MITVAKRGLYVFPTPIETYGQAHITSQNVTGDYSIYPVIHVSLFATKEKNK